MDVNSKLSGFLELLPELFRSNLQILILICFGLYNNSWSTCPERNTETVAGGQPNPHLSPAAFKIFPGGVVPSEAPGAQRSAGAQRWVGTQIKDSEEQTLCPGSSEGCPTGALAPVSKCETYHEESLGAALQLTLWTK